MKLNETLLLHYDSMTKRAIMNREVGNGPVKISLYNYDNPVDVRAGYAIARIEQGTEFLMVYDESGDEVSAEWLELSKMLAKEAKKPAQWRASV